MIRYYTQHAKISLYFSHNTRKWVSQPFKLVLDGLDQIKHQPIHGTVHPLISDQIRSDQTVRIPSGESTDYGPPFLSFNKFIRFWKRNIYLISEWSVPLDLVFFFLSICSLGSIVVFFSGPLSMFFTWHLLVEPPL